MWDYDPDSRNDLIGFAEVPLRGVLVSGRISTGTTPDPVQACLITDFCPYVIILSSGLATHAAPDRAASAGRLITAGALTGALEMVAEPAYTQVCAMAIFVAHAHSHVCHVISGLFEPFIHP